MKAESWQIRQTPNFQRLGTRIQSVRTKYFGNKFLGGEQTLVTVVCSKSSIVKKQHKVFFA